MACRASRTNGAPSARGAAGADRAHADELADAVRNTDVAVHSRRPAPKSWAPTEVICHLRDNEEWFLRADTTDRGDDLPRFVATNPDRWADERQYLTNDAAVALAAFTRRRRETLEFSCVRFAPTPGRAPGSTPIREAGGRSTSFCR